MWNGSWFTPSSADRSEGERRPFQQVAEDVQPGGGQHFAGVLVAPGHEVGSPADLRRERLLFVAKEAVVPGVHGGGEGVGADDRPEEGSS